MSTLPSFTEITSSANLGGISGGSLVFLDSDNDGYIDFYANDETNSNTTARLRQNDGDNTFTDKDSEVGSGSVDQGRGAGAGDYLDIVIEVLYV